MAESGISLERARRHEALVVRLEALLHELRPMAARRPDGKVAAPMRAVAEAMLHDAGRFSLRRRRQALPVAAATLGGLAVQLGQARAGLEAFELTHAYWSVQHKAFVWRSTRPQPVERLRAEVALAEMGADKADKRLRADFLRQFQARVERAYDEGYEDAQTGKPHTGSMAWKRRAQGPVGG